MFWLITFVVINLIVFVLYFLIFYETFCWIFSASMILDWLDWATLCAKHGLFSWDYFWFIWVYVFMKILYIFLLFNIFWFCGCWFICYWNWLADLTILLWYIFWSFCIYYCSAIVFAILISTNWYQTKNFIFCNIDLLKLRTHNRWINYLWFLIISY